jgi:hypothetical protein
LADIGDASGLAGALRVALSGAPEVLARRQAARAQARAKFDNQAAFGKYESLYREMLGTA